MTDLQDNANPRNVLLYAYQRPELTLQSCIAILNWAKLERLVITIDGLRIGASEQEARWRDETIQICRNLALSFAQVEVKVWKDNPGLTNHILRSLRYVFNSYGSVIAVEDDNLISEAGLDFLSDQISSASEPQIAAGFNKFLHQPVDLQISSRKTLFPIQWTTSLNKHMFAVIEQVWKDKFVDKQVVRNRISELKGINLVQRWRLNAYWTDYFTNSINSPRHTDIVVQYATFKAGIFYSVPTGDFVEDIAVADGRGMNFRHNPIQLQYHRLKSYKVDSGLSCATCDLLGSRIEISIRHQVVKSLKLRLTP